MATSLEAHRQERTQRVIPAYDCLYREGSSKHLVPHPSTQAASVSIPPFVSMPPTIPDTPRLWESQLSQLQNRDLLRDLGATSALGLRHLPTRRAAPSLPVSAISQPCSFSFHHLISQLGLTLVHTPSNFHQPTAKFSIFFSPLTPQIITYSLSHCYSAPRAYSQMHPDYATTLTS